MKNDSKFSDEKKWKGVVLCIKDYDNLFCYGVKTTGIFCRPSCRAKTPLRENVIFFDEASEAIKAGFRPCKRCRPDKRVYQPDLELVEKAKTLLDTNYDRPEILKYISKQLGVSTNHLAKLFKQYTDFTPTQYIVKIRVNKSKVLLRQGDIKILDIVYMTGFKSLSNFYKCFKGETGLTPLEYRKSRGDK